MSAGRKNDLEIIYNLQWKHSTSFEKANIVGMYDIPATTLNWESFKSYILKNSGAIASDIIISYVSINEKEFPIESQLDFQIAMYSFRQRARNGDIITLMLEPLDKRTPKRRGAFDNMRLGNKKKSSLECDDDDKDDPPTWFTKYMTTFKKEIAEEITTSVVNQMSTLKNENAGHTPYTYKKANKLGMNAPIMIDKELTKALKLERRLDSKLEKLEQKSKKIREKKLALVDCTEDEAISNENVSKAYLQMGVVSCKETKTLHLNGGEVYCHQWTVMNTGALPWTSKTELCYAWGSACLVPADRVIPLPPLKPGEKDIILTLLNVPTKMGHYECHWFFTHEKQRFGESLTINIIVDPTILKEPASGISAAKIREIADNCSDISSDSIIICTNCNEVNELCDDLNDDVVETEIISSENKGGDNHSIISIANSSSTEHDSSNDEFVVINNGDCCDAEEKTDVKVKTEVIDFENGEKSSETPLTTSSNINNNNDGSEVTVIEVVEQAPLQNTKSDYAFVNINGEKHPIPKYLLRDDYLATAEDAPPPTKEEVITKESASLNIIHDVVDECACDVGTSEQIPLIEDTESVIENTNVAPSIAESTECLPNTSCKASIHSEGNDFSKDNFRPIRDFELNSSFNLNTSQISDSIDAASQATNTSSIKNVPPNYYFDYPLNRYQVPSYPLPIPTDRRPYYSRDSLTIEIPPPPPNVDIRTDYYDGYYSRSFQPYVSYGGLMNDYGHLLQQKKNSERQYWNENGAAMNRPTSRKSNHNLSSSLDMRNEKVMAANDLVTGAVDVASSAINTARSVLNMLNTSEQEKQDNLSSNLSLRDTHLIILKDMGFLNENINKTLLDHFDNDLTKVITELLL